MGWSVCSALRPTEESRSRESERGMLRSDGLRVTTIAAVAVLAALVAVLVLWGAGLAEAAFPGDNGKIAFESERDGNMEIYTMNPDGTAEKNPTSSRGDDQQPGYSANGRQIVFHSNRDGPAEIYRMSAAGTLQTRLTKNRTLDFGPAYSPDGTRIAFTRSVDGLPSNGSDWEIYVMKTDGTQVRRRTINGAIDENPAWSPDGTKIAFNSTRGAGGDFDVWVMNPDGTGLKNLTKDSAEYDGAPDWSPTGNKIAFETDRDGPTAIYTMNANGTDETPLTQNAGADSAPAYSPDGTKIAFVSNRPTTGTNPTGDREIFRMRASGASETQLTFNTAYDANPSWQPLP
jgi:Tol biopolymer transport system component